MPRVLIPLAEGFEELEAITLIDLLRRAEIEVVIAGLTEGPVVAARGTVVVPDTVLDSVVEEDFDMVVLPGGLPGAHHLDDDSRVHRILKRHHAAQRYTAAICAAPKVLANAGLLEGRAATWYPGAMMASDYPHIDPRQEPVVVDGQVVTSRGPGTAMDFALTLIGLLTDEARRDEVERQLQRQP
ncbi:DJ-1 family protein [Thioflavicoccus mobilis 8321]|uniref:DJ-1 family protein n=1 Tax=Thioflavicoccus mobilis 8321 TaxID=765912 RepID=L0H3Z9_9GAMM|nr:DJ-1 family glyoxalase III [Thioflavicoccus mobilis]AGA92324.1 DJ-1 family protein [Thioflavicoccus mobilis 8321]